MFLVSQLEQTTQKADQFDLLKVELRFELRSLIRRHAMKDVFTCAQKLKSTRLSLSHEIKPKISKQKAKNKAHVLEISVNSLIIIREGRIPAVYGGKIGEKGMF